MSHIITFFSATKSNSIGGYTRFKHTKAYIRQKTFFSGNRFKLMPKEKQKLQRMMQALGFSKVDKFIMVKQEWDHLVRRVPLPYFDYIAVDRNILDYTLQLDLDEYHEILQKPRYPKYAIVRIMAAIYTNKRIPEGLTEKEAIDYLFDFMKDKRFRCCLNYPELMTIYLEPDGRKQTIYYPPLLRITENSAIPERGGDEIGVTRIG